MDVYCENEEAVYNVELQAYKVNDLPKRSRYYQDMMDMILLEKKETYSALKKNIVRIHEGVSEYEGNEG